MSGYYPYRRTVGKSKSKYGNRKITVNGVSFDSKKEYDRWCELLLLERAGAIADLRRQVVYELVPKQTDKAGNIVERAVKYKADFVYRDKAGNEIVEDSKGMRTPEYILKRKLMLWRYGISIKET